MRVGTTLQTAEEKKRRLRERPNPRASRPKGTKERYGATEGGLKKRTRRT